MKKFSIVAALAIAVASFVASCGNSGSNKPNLKNDVDTLSYAIGLAQTQGLKQYLVQMDVDTTYMTLSLKVCVRAQMPATTRRRQPTIWVFRSVSRSATAW